MSEELGDRDQDRRQTCAGGERHKAKNSLTSLSDLMNVTRRWILGNAVYLT